LDVCCLLGWIEKLILPRSIVAWFAVCWGLFLVAALVVGAMLVALYKETTTQRTDRAATSIARACDAIVRETDLSGATDGTRTKADYAVAVDRALAPFIGVEGGVWQSGSGSLAYAYPTYEGSGQKTDLPQAEEPTIRQVAEAAALAQRPVEWKRDTRSQVLLISACPMTGPTANTTAWTMTRVVTVGGTPFLLATTGLAFLLVVLLGSAALLGRVLWRWSQKLRTVEAALSAGAEDLPVLEFTGQRDLDRIIGAINGAGAKAIDARRRTVELLQRVADGERLAALGRVAAGVAHEIRNPIAAMRLKAENALANESDRNRSTDALQVVIEQVGRMDQLLQNLLRSVQRSDIKREPMTDIRKFLAEHAELFREQAGRRPITVECPQSLATPVMLDKGQIGRALDNLILNAIQNSDDGTAIALRGEAVEGELHLSVADQGKGVPVAIREHLFEPFATGRPDGTGLGLAIVREVAEAHGGRVSLQHRSDGTTFTLAFPTGDRP
jgi:signal transduction histidine kinase